MLRVEKHPIINLRPDGVMATTPSMSLAEQPRERSLLTWLGITLSTGVRQGVFPPANTPACSQCCCLEVRGK